MYYALLTEVTLSSIVSQLGQVFTGIIGFVGNVATTITGQPLLMLFLGIGMSGTIISTFKRLLRS